MKILAIIFCNSVVALNIIQIILLPLSALFMLGLIILFNL